MIAGEIRAAAVRRSDCRDDHTWVGFDQLGRHVARQIHIGALLFVLEPGERRATSKRTLQVIILDESRMLCRIHEKQVDEFLKGGTA